ncbi:Haloacid dehalogenase-like hydrolase family protein [Clavispora lusitaniae]|uniref:Haloacid dehalogenase-like hydrolase family protein n=1 Tax=Clavispora lusitaniae TaxID=36911 RepID=UPI00202C5BB1|nr:Haloacid dehalogenase-like hydrolase family protein [Clavispora lusitaniae]
MRSVKTRFRLLSDPLRPERIAKSQADTRFPKPYLVSFDLWDTVYTPRKPISQQYYEISHREFGLPLSLESIEEKFPMVYRDMVQKYPNYGKYSGEIHSTNDWWAELIVRLYDIPHFTQNNESRRLCDRLLAHFGSSEAYYLYDDVLPVLETLSRNGIKMIAATNSDDRVLGILQSFGLARYFESVHISYDVGHAKPDRRFFARAAQKHLKALQQQDSNITATDFLERAWHVGDHYEEDFVGAVKSGWNGVLVDREKRSVFTQSAGPAQLSNDCFSGAQPSLDSQDLVMIANNRVCVSGLKEFLRLFDLK